MKLNKKNIIEFIKRKDVIILMSIFLIGLIVRFWNLPDNIIFAYDQGRDAQRVWEMVYQRDLKIVGPETDIRGVFNGPLFYYLLAPIYFLTNFDPNAAAAMFVLINASGIVLLYITAQVLFDNKKVALIAAFLWAISYQQANFARFISNASPMSISTILFFLGLALFIFRKKWYGLPLSAIGLATATHFNFYLIYLGVFYPIYYLIYKPKLKGKPLFISMFLLFALLSPFFLAEIMWKFSATRAFIEYFSHQSVSGGVTESFDKYFDRISEMAYFSFFSFNKTWAFLLTVVMTYIVYKFADKRKEVTFLMIWAFSSFPLFAFSSGVLNGTVINSSVFAPFTLLWALGITLIINKLRLKWLGYGLLAAVVLFNARLMYQDNFRNVHLFAMQPLLLSYEKQLIDYTYESSQGKPFSICGVTNPLFINSLWSHLYKIYGEPKYGRLPYWAGLEQDFNLNHLPYDTGRVETRYFIIEPMGGIPEESRMTFVYNEDHISDLIEEKKFGDIVVQKRKLNLDKEFTDTQNLTAEEWALVGHVNSVDYRYTCFVQY